MNPEQYKVVTDLFLQACDLAEGDRARFLDDACDGDHEVLAEVERMLLQDGRDLPVSGPGASDLLVEADIPPMEPPTCSRADPPESADLPESIGDFRIIELIAHGGMGIVYRAEQENSRRDVALKVIHPGLASPEVVRRFKNEAHVLGKLQHPGIAQVYEAGVAETVLGKNRVKEQPFFSMEYIRGEPLNTYASAEALDLRGKLELFAKICDAVEHAHRRGIIHRDLKPANILVNSHGQPKILDFGVARVADSDMQMVTLQTNVGQLVGTIPYMSPEQVSGQSDDLDTRSDVYALGVLLFELLSGRLPYDVRKRSIADAARVIQEDEPTQLGDCDTSYRGDLETITMKALEKEKSRRYRTAEELANDIRRYLADEPIVARVPSSFYHLRKFAKRNKAIVGGGLATMLALASGLVFSINFALDAKRNAAAAEWTAYTLGITATRSTIATYPTSAARDLGRIPESLRNWEWHHLHAQLDASLAHCAGDAGTVSSAAFLADGTPAAAMIQNGALTLVDVITGETLKNLGPAHSLTHLFISDDGAWLGGFDSDRLEIPIWDVTKGLLVNRIVIPPAVMIANCTFSNNTAPDGSDASSIATAGRFGVEVTDSIIWNHATNDRKSTDNPPPILGLQRDVTVKHTLTDVDPIFVDADGPDNVTGTPDDDLRLRADSPARRGDRVLGAGLRPRDFDVPPDPPAPGTVTVYVDPSASGSDSGESWADAYTDLREFPASVHDCL